MKKIIDFIVEKRLIFIIAFSLLTIVSLFLMNKVNINNDIASYLDPKSDTKVALELMKEEFGSNDQYSLMLENISKEDSIVYQKKISEVEGVASVLYDENNNYKDNNALYVIYLKDEAYSDEAKKCVNEISELVKDYNHYAMGSTVETQFLGDSVVRNMVAILLWACLVVIIIIVLNSKSWIEPLVFVIVVTVSIVINLGTNALLKSISFVTESICAVMQLALAMDYSIMFLHTYMNLREESAESGADSEDSAQIVKTTLRRVTLPILGSSFTTIAGLLALVTMRFKLGVDIGLVLAKGIAISLIVTLFFMPGIIILFSKLIDKTKHRNLYTVILDKFPKIKDKVNKFQYKTRYIIPSILAVLIICGAVFNFKAKFAYTLEASSNPESSINISQDKIQSTFGVQNTVCVLIPKESDIEVEVLDLLKNYKYNGESAFVNFISPKSLHYYDYYTASELSELYGIPSILLSGIYSSDYQKIQLKEIIRRLEETDYIEQLFNDYRAKLNTLNDTLNILDEKLDAKGLADILNGISGVSIYNEDRALNIMISIYGTSYSDHTFRELIYYLVENNYLYNHLNYLSQYEVYYNELGYEIGEEEAKYKFGITADLSEFYNSADNTLRSLVDYINEKHISYTNPVFDEYLNVVQSCDIMLNKDYVSNTSINNFNILPIQIYDVVFITNNDKYIHEIVSLINAIIRAGDYKERADMSSFKGYLKYVEEDISIEEVSNISGLDEDTINAYLLEFGIELGNLKEVCSEIIENEVLDKLYEKITNKLSESFELMHYALSQVEGTNYNRIVTNMIYKRSSDEQAEILRDLKGTLKENYDNTLIVSEGSPFLDFEDTFAFDSILINVLSFVFILIIIALSFRSLSIPLILNLLIEGAIWVTLGISVISAHNEYFICYLMVVCIQMGTTIDYGILFTSNYVSRRKELDKLDALKEAYFTSLPTILTSGVIIIVAAFIVGKISEVSIISSIGFLLSKGTIISVLFIILALPQVLLLFDKLIIKKK